jgi:hypothetical protein
MGTTYRIVTSVLRDRLNVRLEFVVPTRGIHRTRLEVGEWEYSPFKVLLLEA